MATCHDCCTEATDLHDNLFIPSSSFEWKPLPEPASEHYQLTRDEEHAKDDFVLGYENGTSSIVVALDFARPRSLAYLSAPAVLYFSR